MSGDGWLTINRMVENNQIHVIPNKDKKEHLIGLDCECKPSLEVINNHELIVHNSYDFREVAECLNDESEA